MKDIFLLRLHRLLDNSRFWILVSGVVLSFIIVGSVQLLVPPGSLQTIRIEQFCGFISLVLLYAALLASPLTKVYPQLPFKDVYLHARRAIGVLTFYYAFLHVYISFFGQLGGFSGVAHLNRRFAFSLWLGIFALAVLFIMAVTSLDWAVDTLGFKNWKLLHRLVYLAGLAILIHIILIGPHYSGLGFLSTLTSVGVVALLWLEAVRILRNIKRKQRKS